MRVYTAITLAVLVVFGCSSDQRFRSDPAVTGNEDILSFYANQSQVTSPGEYVYLYDGIQRDIGSCVEAIHGTLLHRAQIESASIPLSRRLIRHDINVNTVEQMLAVIAERDDRPLTMARGTENRFVGICSHHALLTCSLLRYHGIPCRVRGGFETHSSEMHHDHWICEYWNSALREWVKVDPEINTFLRNRWGVKYDNLDLPDSIFITGAAAWIACKAGDIDAVQFGVSGDEWSGGWDFVLNSVVLDFLALNKVELLPWDDIRPTSKGFDRLTPEEHELIDRVAYLSTDAAVNFKRLRRLYKDQDMFRK